MLDDIRLHSIHYSVLAFIMMITGVLLFLASYSSELMMVIIIMGTGAYVSWGILHHYLIEDLTSQIVIEYLTIAMLVIVLFGVSI